MNMNTWQIALFLALVNERLVEYFVAPLYEKFWQEGRWTLLYVSAVTGGLLSFLAGVDLMGMAGVILPHPANLIISAIIVGGGSNMVSGFFDILKGLGGVLGWQARKLILQVRAWNQ